MSDRLRDLDQFYALMNQLAQQNGGTRFLCDCSGKMAWPKRGVYFFFEDGEFRNDGVTPRVVRVGTHALKMGGKATLWNRLSQHRGSATSTDGRNRTSVFRRLVGLAVMDKDAISCPTWAQRHLPPRPPEELDLEQRVSTIIRPMPLLRLAIDDDPGPHSMRGDIERNSIALLSNWNKPALDSPSNEWLGRHCPRERVRNSGLWNQNHVEEAYEPEFLVTLAKLIRV